MPTASTLNSVSRIVPDAAYVEDPYNAYYPNPEIRMSVYERNATHSLSISRGNTTIITMQLTHTYPTGNNWVVTVTMSDAQRATLISSMSDVASFTATYTLTTYLNGSAIGTSTAQALVELHYSSPSYTSITYRDINPSTIALTGDNQKIIQGASDLEFTVTGATPGRSTTLKEYFVTAWSTTGNVTRFPASEVPSGVLLYGNVNLGLSESANARFDVGVRDARNTSKETSLSIPIIVLVPPRITAYDIKRNASDSTRLDFSFSGTCDTLTQSNISASFKYKLKTDSTYSAAISLSGLTTNTGTFTCSTTYSGVTFLEDKNYDIQLIVTDGINTDTINLTILHATIHVAFREEAIGLGTVPHGTKRVEIAQDWSLVANGKNNVMTYMPYSWAINANYGTDGYERIATIVLDNLQETIHFRGIRRLDKTPFDLYFQVDGNGGIRYFNANFPVLFSSNYPFSAFAITTGTLTYDIYIKKINANDWMTIWVEEGQWSQGVNASITYSPNLLASIPSGATMATPLLPSEWTPTLAPTSSSCTLTCTARQFGNIVIASFYAVNGNATLSAGQTPWIGSSSNLPKPYGSNASGCGYSGGCALLVNVYTTGALVLRITGEQWLANYDSSIITVTYFTADP